MKTVSRLLFFLLALFLLALCYLPAAAAAQSEELALCGDSAAYRAHKRAQDVQRLKDLKYIAGLIEEYRQKVGRYPLVEKVETGRLGLVLTRRSLRKEYRVPPPGITGRAHPNGLPLERALTKGLGRKISLPEDPQKLASFAPNFYQYLVTKDAYYVSTYLFYKAKGSLAIGPRHHYKIELSSTPSPEKGIYAHSPQFNAERIAGSPQQNDPWEKAGVTCIEEVAQQVKTLIADDKACEAVKLGEALIPVLYAEIGKYPNPMAIHTRRLGYTMLIAGKPKRARSLCEYSLKISTRQKVEDPTVFSNAYNCLRVAALQQEEGEAADRYAKKLADITKTMSDPARQKNMVWLANHAFDRGREEEALRRYKELAKFFAADARSASLLAEEIAGKIALLEKRYSEAIRRFERLLKSAKDQLDRESQGVMRRTSDLAVAVERSGDSARAIELWNEVLSIAARLVCYERSTVLQAEKALARLVSS